MTICKEYNLMLKEAISRKKQIKKLFDRIHKSKKSKELGLAINQFHHEAFEEIDCLKCANCCSSISPMITDNDIKRMAPALKIKPSKVVEQYLEMDDENDYIFTQSPCPFLNPDDLLCCIYTNRPKACREYPHTDDKRIMNLLPITYKNTFVCPAVYLVVQKLEKSL